MNKDKTYKAPVIMSYCPRCKARTLNEHIDHPDEMERDTVCARCGALKATERMKEETPAMRRAAFVFFIIQLVSFIVNLIALWYIDDGGAPVALVASAIGAASWVGTIILYRNCPKEDCPVDNERWWE